MKNTQSAVARSIQRSHSCQKIVNFFLTEFKVFHIQSGTKITGHSVFKVLSLVTDDFHPTLYFIFCRVTMISVGMSLISTLLSRIIVIMLRNRFLNINAMLP